MRILLRLLLTVGSLVLMILGLSPGLTLLGVMGFLVFGRMLNLVLASPTKNKPSKLFLSATDNRPRYAVVRTQDGLKKIPSSYFLGEDRLKALYAEVMSPVPSLVAASYKIASAEDRYDPTDWLIEAIDKELDPPEEITAPEETCGENHAGMSTYEIVGDDRVLCEHYECGCPVKDVDVAQETHNLLDMLLHDLNNLGKVDHSGNTNSAPPGQRPSSDQSGITDNVLCQGHGFGISVGGIINPWKSRREIKGSV